MLWPNPSRTTGASIQFHAPSRNERSLLAQDVRTFERMGWLDGTTARPLADDHHAFHEDAEPGDLAGQLLAC